MLKPRYAKIQTAQATAKLLWENFIRHYGFPEKFLSDQGRNFESELISELCKLAKVEKVHTTPYHPMTNGQCERSNSTLCNMLGTLPEKEKADWKSHLGSMTHAYNCTKHPSTTYFPYYLMFGRQPRLPIDYEMGLPIDVLGDTCSKTNYVQKLKQRLDFAYKRAREISQKQAQKYKLSYDKKVKGSQLQVDDIVLVKGVAWKGRHKIQNKWEPNKYVVVSQPNKNAPVYRVKPIGERNERVLHRNLLLPLGIKFVPEIKSESDSDHEEEPELEIFQVERQISEGKPQATSVENMTPLADLGHWQGIVDSKLDSVVTPVHHVELVEQGSMAPPAVISTDNLLIPKCHWIPNYLFPSMKLFVQSQHNSLICQVRTQMNSETFTSSNECELIEAQDISSIEVPKENGSVDSTNISITESQFSSTMPYCEESLVGKIDPMGTNQFLSVQKPSSGLCGELCEGL